VLRAPLVRLLPRLFALDLLLELRALELQAQLVFLVCTQVILLKLPGLAPLVIVKLKLRGGGGILAAPLTSRSHEMRSKNFKSRRYFFRSLG